MNNFKEAQNKVMRNMNAEIEKNKEQKKIVISNLKFKKQIEIRDNYLRNGFSLEVANNRSGHDVQAFFS